MTTLLEPQLRHAADAFLDEDRQQESARNLGELFYAEFGAEGEGRVSSQLRGLQQIAVTATRFSDIEDFVKNQMGRSSDSSSSRKWRRVGEEMLQQLTALRQKAGQLSSEEGQRYLLRLHLARGWSRAVVGAYLYAKAHEEMQRHA